MLGFIGASAHYLLRTLRAAFAAANDAIVPEDRPHPTAKVEANGAMVYHAILTDRATSVPFRAVLTGPERTTIDNAEAPLTCATFCLRRPQSCPIWLWEQGVAWLSLIGPCRARPADPRRGSPDGIGPSAQVHVRPLHASKT
jgi:hypothetical protein